MKPSSPGPGRRCCVVGVTVGGRPRPAHSQRAARTNTRKSKSKARLSHRQAQSPLAMPLAAFRRRRFLRLRRCSQTCPCVVFCLLHSQQCLCASRRHPAVPLCLSPSSSSASVPLAVIQHCLCASRRHPALPLCLSPSSRNRRRFIHSGQQLTHSLTLQPL